MIAWWQGLPWGFPERMTPVAEDDKSTSGVVPRLVQEFTAQLGATTKLAV